MNAHTHKLEEESESAVGATYVDDGATSRQGQQPAPIAGEKAVQVGQVTKGVVGIPIELGRLQLLARFLKMLVELKRELAESGDVGSLAGRHAHYSL